MPPQPPPPPLMVANGNPADVMAYGERPLAATDIPEAVPLRCLCGGNDVTAIAALGGRLRRLTTTHADIGQEIRRSLESSRREGTLACARPRPRPSSVFVEFWSSGVFSGEGHAHVYPAYCSQDHAYAVPCPLCLCKGCGRKEERGVSPPFAVRHSPSVSRISCYDSASCSCRQNLFSTVRLLYDFGVLSARIIFRVLVCLLNCPLVVYAHGHAPWSSAESLVCFCKSESCPFSIHFSEWRLSE